MLIGASVNPVTEEPPAPPVEVVEEQPAIPEKVEPLQKTWDDLTTAEKIRENPNNCDLNTEWMWGDGSCHKKSSPSVSKTTPPAKITGDKNTWLVSAGIPSSDWSNVDFIITRESGWNPNAVNASSGACGLGQQLPCGKWPHTWNEPVGALKDAYNYMLGRYGSTAAAVSFWQANHWY